MNSGSGQCFRIFSFALLFSWVFASSESFAQLKSEQPARSGLAAVSYQQSRDDLAVLFRQLKKERRAVDESEFSPDALAINLGPDITGIFQWVRDKIAFQPYQGGLRLGQGTLMSRAGNSFDQSLLLAQMLRTQGHTIRYARGRLSHAQVAKLVASTNSPDPVASTPTLAERLAAMDTDRLGERAEFSPDEIRSLATSNQAALDEFQQALQDQTQSMQDLLSGQLEQAGVGLGALSSERANRAEAAVEHCWVQLKTAQGWMDLDPSLASNAVGTALTEATTISDSLPTEGIAHQLHFTVNIEQEKNGEVLVKKVLDRTLPLVEAVNHISYFTVPENIGGSMAESVQDPDFLSTVDVMLPVLKINGAVIAGDPFNMEGDIVASDPDMRNAENVRKPLSRGMDAASSALGNLFAPAAEKTAIDYGHLSSVWMTVGLVRPDGSERSLRRELARRQDPAADSFLDPNPDMVRQLLSGFDILASGSRISSDFVETRYLDHYLDNRAVFFLGLAYASGEEPQNEKQVINAGSSSYPFPLLEFLYTRMAAAGASVTGEYPGLAVYAAEPQVVAFRVGADIVAGEMVIRERFDIMFNSLEAFELAGNFPDRNRAQEFRFQQGIFDTSLEYLMLGGGEAVNAHSVIKQALDSDITLLRVTADNINDLPLDGLIRAAMTRDLDAGYVIVAPAEAVNIAGHAAFAWWRIHPETGDTLGMAGFGEGMTMAEYIQQVGIGLEVAAMVCGLITVIGLGGRSFENFGKCMAWGIGAAVLGPAMIGGMGMHPGVFLALFCAMFTWAESAADAWERTKVFSVCLAFGFILSKAMGPYVKWRMGGPKPAGSRPVEEAGGPKEGEAPRVEEFDPTAEELTPEEATRIVEEEIARRAQEEGEAPKVEEFDPSAPEEVTPEEAARRMQEEQRLREAEEYLEQYEEGASKVSEEVEAKRQTARERAENAGTFDTPEGTPAHRAKTPRLTEGNSVRVQDLTDGYSSDQPHLYQETVNRFVQEMIDNPRWYENYSDQPIRFNQIKNPTADNPYGKVITDGHHRFVAAQIAAKVTGRPVMGGKNPIIPAEAIGEPLPASQGSDATGFSVEVRPGLKPR